jgi:hypothetical protein
MTILNTYGNFGFGTLTSPLSSIGASLTVTFGGTANVFPTGISTVVVYSSLYASASLSPNKEIMQLTFNSGTTYSIYARALEGTTAQNWNAGDNIAGVLTAGMLTEIKNNIPSLPVSLTTGVSGVLPIANGGTNAITAPLALTALGAAPAASPTFTGTVTLPDAATITSSGYAANGVSGGAKGAGTINATNVYVGGVAVGGSGGMTAISTLNPVTQSSYLCSWTLVPGIRYKLIMNLIQNTTVGDFEIQFNGDTGSNYRCNLSGNNGGAAYSSNNGAGQTAIFPSEYLILAIPTSSMLCEINFVTFYGTNTSVSVEGIYKMTEAGPSPAGFTFWGDYTGGSPLSSITIGTNAGTFSGYASLYTLN